MTNGVRRRVHRVPGAALANPDRPLTRAARSTASGGVRRSARFERGAAGHDATAAIGAAGGEGGRTFSARRADLAIAGDAAGGLHLAAALAANQAGRAIGRRGAD